DLEDAANVREPVARGAVHLRHAAQRVRVLHARVVFSVRVADLRVGEECTEPFGTPCLPRMRADLLDLRRERVGRSTQCLEAERTRNIDRVDRTLGGEQRQDADAGVRLCPVVECEPFLRLENEWRQAEASERIRTAHPLALDPRLAFAHQYECEMRQWC